ncbi:hypothetical protein Tco_0185148 [Tanacetum coccineum]
MSWLGSTNAYDEPIISLGMMDNEVGNTCPKILPSFEEYTPPVTYPEEVEETLGTPIEVKPLDETKLEDLGLNTCNHDIPLSSRVVPSFDESEPQPNLLPNSPSLDISIRHKRGLEPPIKPYSLSSFRMKFIFDKESPEFLGFSCDSNLLSRKAHLLEDKQIPSVGVFDEVIWMAFEGNTRDLDSIWEETRQDCNFTRRYSRFGLQRLETASTFLVTPSEHSMDDIKIL